jgi:hypothetical protein
VAGQPGQALALVLEADPARAAAGLVLAAPYARGGECVARALRLRRVRGPRLLLRGERRGSGEGMRWGRRPDQRGRGGVVGEERAGRNMAGQESSLGLVLEQIALGMSGGGERAKGAADFPGREVAGGYVRSCRFCIGLIVSSHMDP